MSSTIITRSHPAQRFGIPALVLAGLLWQPLIGLARTTTDPAQHAAPPTPVPALAAALPNTDGTGLLPAPPPLPKSALTDHAAPGKDACSIGCVTKFGRVLGAANGVPGHSNCAATCVSPAYSFLDMATGAVSIQTQDPHQPALHSIGIVYQCVEYARRWWMQRRGLTFGDVEGAVNIIYLTEGEQLRTGKPVALARSINGTAQRAPQLGDLIVYYADRQDPEWRYGHVAVVVGVDLGRGNVALAEQNYDNARWQAPQRYARQIRLFQVGGRYTLVDVPPRAVKNPGGGRIAGWIYPFAAQ